MIKKTKYQSLTFSLIMHLLALVLLINIPTPLQHPSKKSDTVEDLTFSIDLVYTHIEKPTPIPIKKSPTKPKENPNSKPKSSKNSSQEQLQKPKKTSEEKSQKPKQTKKPKQNPITPNKENPSKQTNSATQKQKNSTIAVKKHANKDNQTKQRKSPQSKQRKTKAITTPSKKNKQPQTSAVKNTSNNQLAKHATKSTITQKTSKKPSRNIPSQSKKISSQKKSPTLPTKRTHPSQKKQRYQAAAHSNKKAIPYIPPKPKQVSRPPYPKYAQRKKLSGKVILLLEINKNGQVINVQIAQSSSHTSLDKSAIKAAYKWKFWPAKLGNKHVAGKIKVPINFHL